MWIGLDWRDDKYSEVDFVEVDFVEADFVEAVSDNKITDQPMVGTNKIYKYINI